MEKVIKNDSPSAFSMQSEEFGNKMMERYLEQAGRTTSKEVPLAAPSDVKHLPGDPNRAIEMRTAVANRAVR